MEAQALINDPKTQKWIRNITPYVIPHLKAGKTIEEAITLGCEEYRVFLVEMLEQKTERSRHLAGAIFEATYKQIRLENGIAD